MIISCLAKKYPSCSFCKESGLAYDECTAESPGWIGCCLICFGVCLGIIWENMLLGLNLVGSSKETICDRVSIEKFPC